MEAFDPAGKSLGVIFETAGPFETPLRMQALVAWAVDAYAGRKLHPLLVTSMFIVEFLAIHPFQDGNGRLSRILTTYLLLREGYHYVPYSSLEAVIEQSKESYYLALRKTQGTLRNEDTNWQPWILYFLQALHRQKKKLESKVEQESKLLMQLPELSLQILYMVRSRGKATISEIITVTDANRNTVKRHLEKLVGSNRLRKHGAGKGTWYTL